MARRSTRPLRLAAALLTLVCVAIPVEAQQRAAADRLDPALLAGMEARQIGPAGMSGRIASIDVVASDPDVIYIGAATSGVWKSENRGLTWQPLFDEQPVHSIGAVAVFQPSSDVVWVGTGEGNTRNSTSVGNGVYRSLDGGRTWEHLGLENTERIHKIVLHPTDPDVAYVAALGRLWGENPERGVYRTTDGGATWERILYVNERTGAADLAMDHTNPRKLFAAMWEHGRRPYYFESGGPGSGLYVTHDGGDTWERRTVDDGLPEGDLGRIGIGVSRSNPEIVYALVEAERSALLRSEDGGESFRAVNRETNIAPRPFYYARIWVDPLNPDRVYNVHSLITRSEDGGRTFETLVPFNRAHPDHHAFWIHPEDPELLMTGNDGGFYLSDDRGEHWDFSANLPFAQFYHIRVDRETPYHVYGGLQDNGSWKGPAEVWENGGVRNHHWEEIAFGDGFDASPDPEDAMKGYAMSQEGFLVRWNLRTGERRSVRPPSPDPDTELRFNWNAGFAQDPFDAGTIYYGSQFVHRSTDRGESWDIISPDLTTDNPEWQVFRESGGLTPDVTGAENFTTIVAIEPSPVELGMLWVGTDDGRLHVTRNGGEDWTSVEGNVPGVPANTWIPHIHASPHDAGTAFVVFDNHRRDDWTPYVYRTADFGSTWTRIAGEGSGSGPRTREARGGDVWGYALTVVQDPIDPELLFLGTEFGLFVSLDGGGRWVRWEHGVPTASVMDLAIQPDEADLVLGTHGRSVYVLDDIRPLRGLDAATLAEPLHLFEIPDAIQYEVKQTGASRFPGQEEFRGENEPYGALITFVANRDDLPHPDEEVERARKERERDAARTAEAVEDAEVEGEEAEVAGEEAAAASEAMGPLEGPSGAGSRAPRVGIEISDADGEVVRHFERPVKLGINRIAWNLRRDGFDRPDTGEEEEEFSFFGPSGAEALPGTYTVTLRLGDQEASGTVRVLADPRQQIALADRRRQHEAVMEGGALQDALAGAITNIYRARREIDAVLRKARESGEGEEDAGAEDAGGQESAGPHAELVRAGRELRRQLTELEERLWVPPETKGIVASDHLPWSQVQGAIRFLGSTREAPSETNLAYLEAARVAVQAALEQVNALFADGVAAFRERVEASDLTLFPEFEPVVVESP